MNFEKGQILDIPVTTEDSSRRNRYVLVQDIHDILPVIAGYLLSSIGAGRFRKPQAVTNIPLVPGLENNLTQPAAVCMDTEYVLDQSTTLHIIGHLDKTEQEIMDDYDGLIRKHGLVRQATLADLDQKLADQYTVLKAMEANDAQRVQALLRRYDGWDDCLSRLPLLHGAAKHDAAESAKVALRFGAYTDGLDPAAKTPLWYAVDTNSTNVAQVLLDAGANMNLRVAGRSVKEAVRSVKMRKVLEKHAEQQQKARGLAV